MSERRRRQGPDSPAESETAKRRVAIAINARLTEVHGIETGALTWAGQAVDRLQKAARQL